METLKTGDIIQWFAEDGEEGGREEVRGRVDGLIFTRRILFNKAKGAVEFGPTEGPHEIEDLITWGYKKVE